MCLAIPAQITEFDPADPQLATVDILGARRQASVALLADDPPLLGDWVLVHVGFALSKISAERAAEQLEMLAILGEDAEARAEVGAPSPPPAAGGDPAS